MQVGDIIFVRGKTLISNLIRYFDPGDFSHIAICISPTHVLESQRFVNTRITPFYFSDYEIIDLGLNDEQKEKVVHMGIDLVGKQYDYIQLLQYVFDDFGWKLNLNNPNNLICSELVGNLLRTVGRLPKDERTSNMSPNELYRYLKGIEYDKSN
jgi:hypothetical protein